MHVLLMTVELLELEKEMPEKPLLLHVLLATIELSEEER